MRASRAHGPLQRKVRPPLPSPPFKPARLVVPEEVDAVAFPALQAKPFAALRAAEARDRAHAFFLRIVVEAFDREYCRLGTDRVLDSRIHRESEKLRLSLA